MQKLEVFQSLWGMEQRMPGKAEPSMEENFSKVAAAGFDGMCIDLGADEVDQFRDASRLYEEYGLHCMVNAFPEQADDLRPVLQLAKDFNACMVNVIGGVMPIKPADAVPVIHGWIKDGHETGMPLLFETHRDGMLNDLYYTLQVIDLVPEIRLCADLSHFVVDREFRSPIPDVDQEYIHRVLERSDCFQGRIANREQIQIQINFPQHQEWVEIFKDWWKKGMRMWRDRNNDDTSLVFLCELGPRPYAITDGEQRELSDRWQEALQIRQWVREIWTELETE
jgi:hypothetical protein